MGQDLSFREQYDVAVARAVAEMRILGNYVFIFIRCLCNFKYFISTKLVFIVTSDFQLSIVFLWFVLEAYLSLQRVMILR